jgi:hypothetical protein
VFAHMLLPVFVDVYFFRFAGIAYRLHTQCELAHMRRSRRKIDPAQRLTAQK